MAVAFDAASNPTAGTGELSWTHTPVGTPRGILVLITQDSNSSADEVSGVTYGGTAMTRVNTAADIALEECRSYVYFLGASVPTGNQTVVVSVSAASAKQAVAISVTAGADTEVEDSQIVEGDQADPSVTLTTGAGVECFVAGVLASGASNPASVTPGGDYTEILEHDFGAQVGSYMRRTSNSTGGSVTVNWTAVSDDVAGIGVAITEAAVGDPEASLIGGKLIRGGLLMRGALVG